MSVMRRTLKIAVACLCVASGRTTAPAADDYAATIERHRAERVARLTAPDGWLTLAGLFWLGPGENQLGSDPGGAVVLMAPGVPALAGSLFLEGSTVRLVPAPGAGIVLDGEPVAERVLRDDADGRPDVLAAGRLSFHVIKRGERFGVRVKDPEAPARKAFRGIEYFPLDPAWRVRGTFEPFARPREVQLTTMAGTVERLLAPGTVTFEVHGARLTLVPFVERAEDQELWFIFADRTSGKETYGFRYLYADSNRDGPIELDFNAAYNPPCAFTPYATCPIAPRENRLDVRVEAGEKIYRHEQDRPAASAH